MVAARQWPFVILRAWITKGLTRDVSPLLDEFPKACIMPIVDAGWSSGSSLGS